MTEIRSFIIEVPGRPVGQGSKRHVGNGRMVESSARLPVWRNQVAALAAAAWTGPPTDAAVTVRINVYRARPRSHYGTGRNGVVLKPSAPQHCFTPPDGDKVARACLDAMSGVIYRDDRQVVDLWITRDWGQRDWTAVHAWELL